MYVDELELSDFRAIASSRLRFTHPHSEGASTLEYPNMNVLFGLNGCGKSSVLKALAAAFAVGRGDRRPEMSGWPRVGSDGDLRVQVHWTDASPESRFASSSFQVHRNGRVVRDGVTPGGFMASYGVSRRVAASGDAVAIEAQTGGSSLLFEDDSLLMPLDHWFDGSPYKNQVASILNLVLPADVQCVGERHRAGGYFTQRGVALPLEALSDGVRSFLAWVCDLLWRLSRRLDDEQTGARLDEVSGVVLVDEIDQRMHPGWQQVALTRLAAVLPSLQWVCAAHSPLIPSGLRRQNLLLAELDRDMVGAGATTVGRLATEEVYGRTADQVLESSYFSLTSSRSEVFRRELRAIASRAQSRRSGRQAALEFMRRLADPDGGGGGAQ